MKNDAPFNPYHRTLNVPEPPSLDTCPVQPLGRRSMKFYFFGSSGEVQELNHRQIQNEAALCALFDGSIVWLLAQPYFAGKHTGSIDWRVVGRWLMQECANRGIWDPSLPRRGPGVWRGADGSLIVHAGDAVLINGEWVASGRRVGNVLFPAAPALLRPAPASATSEIGRRLLDAARLWRYADSEIAPDLVIGLVGAALLGAAPIHRAHALLTGPFGNGKSELLNFIGAILGSGAQPPGNDVTAASLHQMFTGEARSLLLDEAEQDGGPEKLMAVVMLMRRMSTGEGARIMRGSSAGQATQFSVTGSAFLAAILPPALKPQDRSRFTEIRVTKLDVDPTNPELMLRFQRAIDYAAEVSPQIRARAINGWSRFQETFRVYHTAFMEQGMQPRDANQAATILAGRDLLISDEVPQSDGLRYEIERFKPMIAWAAENQGEGEGVQALDRLLTFPVEGQKPGERRTIAQLIWDVFYNPSEASVASKKLASCGVRAEGGGNQPCVLWVARRHEFLRKVYQGSNWDNRWSEALRQLEGAKIGNTCQRFGGPLLRYTIIPEHWLPVEDDPTLVD